MRRVHAMNTEPSFYAQIWIAGDKRTAIEACRSFCMKTPLCVTVNTVSYVYTGGLQTGVCVRLFNYPRFPASTEQIMEKARALAEHLKVALCQRSYSIEYPHETTWIGE